MTDPTDAAREARVHRAIDREGLVLQESHVRVTHNHDQGGWRVIEPDHNIIVAGENFDLTLDDLEDMFPD